MSLYLDPVLATDALRDALMLKSDSLLCASLAEMLALELRAGPEPQPSMGDQYPALEHWRRLVLERGGVPIEEAAAWELTALTCESDGAGHLVDECLANAERALGATT
jgi:hypothetical protein